MIHKYLGWKYEYFKGSLWTIWTPNGFKRRKNFDSEYQVRKFIEGSSGIEEDDSDLSISSLIDQNKSSNR